MEKKKILIVDDSKSNILGLKLILKNTNYEIDSALSGPEALEKLKSYEPAAILLDIMMPEMDGLEVLERIMADEKTSHLPVIMVTAKSTDKDLALAFEKGAIDFVKKPINELELKARLKTALKIKNQEDLRSAKENAEKANQAKTEFLRNMSHELKTPLNAIVGFSSLLIKDEMDPERREMLENIHISGLNLLSHLNAILEYARMESGNIEIRPLPFSMRELVSNLKFKFNPFMEKKNLLFQTQVHADFPENIMGDMDKISAIMGKILDNAVKFTKKGSVILECKYVDNKAEIIVTDTGCGISPEAEAFIFSPFRQGDNSLTKNYAGLGIGLRSARMILEKMQGEISFTSSEEGGSSFFVKIPLMPA
jgi:signal transduction histidine kinase